MLETVKEFGIEEPFPSIAGELAARSILVLSNPLHKLYSKVNKYMNKGPVWEIGKIPSYWIDKILLNEPEYDDSHLEEVDWLLDLLINGLRSESVSDSYYIVLFWDTYELHRTWRYTDESTCLRGSSPCITLRGLTRT